MRVHRLPLRDQYFDEEESAVMVGDEVIALSALATSILALVPDEGTTSDFLGQALEDRYGPPPSGVDALQATEMALSDLKSVGLVQLFPGE